MIVHFFQVGILAHLMGICLCWQYFTTIYDLDLINSLPDVEHTHSEYIFGDCKRPDKVFFAHVHKDHMEVLGKVIIRLFKHQLTTDHSYTKADIVLLDYGDAKTKFLYLPGWLDIVRIPTCIVLRATSYEEDMFRNTAYRFQLCVPRITYCHSQKRHKYYFYEWYIPEDMIGGMNWDIYFYGPSNLVWQ